ncbi:MAG: HAD family hydrolase [Planctomycetota bacterium]|jgi:putative hydrolase of the HAD superfamily
MALGAERPPRWVLFDYGNTLVPYGRREAVVLYEVVAECVAGRIPGVDATSFAEKVRDVKHRLIRGTRETLREVTIDELATELAREAGSDAAPDGMAAEIAAAAGEKVIEILELPDATIPVLDSLRERVTMGVVSNYYLEHPIHESLRRFGIADRMETAVVSCEVGHVKPHPAVFETALDALGADPAETVFVGDNLHADVAGAGALGMRTVHITQWHAGAIVVDSEDQGEPPVPDAVIERLDQLPELLFGEDGR